jgi:hypothetical protein
VTFGTVAQALTDAEGRFRIRGLGDAEGALVFADEDPRYLPLTMAARPGQSALRAVLERRPRIVGRLDALPASRLQQTLMGWGDECTGRAVRVGRDGRFELPSVPAGREFWLMLENEGRIPWIFLGLKLAPDETLDLGVLRLPEGLTLRGTVTDKSGMPIANADVRAWSGIENLEWGCSARTDAEGRFAIPDLADIPFEVTVEVPDYVPKSLGIARAGSAPPLAIVLERGGVLEIRGADGDVEVEPLGGGERVTVPTNGGNADVTLPPGRYRIDAETFEIRVGDTTRIELGD